MVNSSASLRWLITGGCGFIGTSLINHLLRNDPTTSIRILDNLSVGTKEDLQEVLTFIKDDTGVQPATIEMIEGDIRNADDCLSACKEIDIIVHLAANTGVAPSVENPRYDMETNVIGTFNMLESARQNNVPKFILASSGATIGEVAPPIHEEKVPKPVSPYGASKLAGEAYCSAYYRTFSIKTICLRFANVYGPLSKHKNSVVAKFLKKAFSGEPLEIYGDGRQTRDFIYIDDLIKAILLCAESDIGGEAFQIATYKETTVNEIAEMIKALVENRTGKSVDIIHGETRLGDVKRNYSDISKAKNMLGFNPEFTLETGLKNTFEYFRSKTT
jgi:UDP-glucose 4-epimerase